MDTNCKAIDVWMVAISSGYGIPDVFFYNPDLLTDKMKDVFLSLKGEDIDVVSRRMGFNYTSYHEIFQNVEVDVRGKHINIVQQIFISGFE